MYPGPTSLFQDEPIPIGHDPQLDKVTERLQLIDLDGSIFATVLRETLDQLLDGQRTGRYTETELRKTEKTHMGTLVEINLHRAFDFDDGTVTDYRIAGIEVDCKFSRTFGGWEIPLEAHGHICLLLWADDQQSLWSAGVVRIQDTSLVAAQNRDRKRRLSSSGLAHSRWLHRNAPLPENLLLHLPANVRATIFSHPTGQRRVIELFRQVQQRIIPRTAVLTAAQQKDAPKRVRDARRVLRGEGIVILGHQGDHPRIARALNLPIPAKGEWVSASLVLAGRAEPDSIPISGNHYRLAREDDETADAPILDSQTEEEHD